MPAVHEVEARAIQLVLATHPDRAESVPLAKKYVRYGASPRGAQALMLCAKADGAARWPVPCGEGRYRRVGAAGVAASDHFEFRRRS